MQMTRVSSLRLRWQLLATALGMVAVLLATLFTPFVGSLNLYLQDWLLRITTRAPLPKEFALVTIDERSLSLGEVSPEEIAESRPLQLMQAGFPWSREVYAALTEKLMAAGARLVIFDLLFPTSREGDQLLASALKAHAEKVVLAASFENPDSQDRGANAPLLVVPNEEFREAVKENWGIVNLPMWRDNKVRSLYTAASASNIMGVPTLPHEEVVPSLATVSARLLGATFRRIPNTSRCAFAIRCREQLVSFLFLRSLCRSFGSQITVTERFSRIASFLSEQRPSGCMTFISRRGASFPVRKSTCMRSPPCFAEAGSSRPGSRPPSWRSFSRRWRPSA